MKFKKIPDVYLFPKYIREDGKYTIKSTCRQHKSVFVVTDCNGNEIATYTRLKEAKAAFEND